MFSVINQHVTNAIAGHRKDIWLGSPFESLVKKLTNDERGKVGELTLMDIFKQNGIAYKYYGDKVSSNVDSNKVYDIIVMHEDTPVFVEVKTSYLGNSNTFQHENLKNNSGSNYWMFIDVEPNTVHLTVIRAFDLSTRVKHSILGVTPHLRKDTTNVYKLDTSPNILKRTTDAGITVSITDDTGLKEAGDFLKRMLIPI